MHSALEVESIEALNVETEALKAKTMALALAGMVKS